MLTRYWTPVIMAAKLTYNKLQENTPLLAFSVIGHRGFPPGLHFRLQTHRRCPLYSVYYFPDLHRPYYWPCLSSPATRHYIVFNVLCLRSYSWRTWNEVVPNCLSSLSRTPIVDTTNSDGTDLTGSDYLSRHHASKLYINNNMFRRCDPKMHTKNLLNLKK